MYLLPLPLAHDFANHRDAVVTVGIFVNAACACGLPTTTFNLVACQQAQRLWCMEPDTFAKKHVSHAARYLLGFSLGIFASILEVLDAKISPSVCRLGSINVLVDIVVGVSGVDSR